MLVIEINIIRYITHVTIDFVTKWIILTHDYNDINGEKKSEMR